MKYLKVEWLQRNPAFPVLLFSEIGRDGYEARKVNVYADGHYEFADDTRSTGTTFLGEEPVPAIEHIAAQTEFAPQVISRDEFESAWVSALAAAERHTTKE